MAPSALPLIVNLAPTGAVADAGKNAAVPLSANAIVADLSELAHAYGRPLTSAGEVRSLLALN